MADLAIWLISGALVVVTVLIHYEVMRMTSDIVIPWASRRFHDRRVMVLTIASLLGGHIIEIWIFALAMMLLIQYPSFGTLGGDFDGTINSFAYFSAVSYTSLGYGDILPRGPMRSVAVSETLTGLMMIAWSASFAYLKMEEFWRIRRERHHAHNHQEK